MCRYFNVIKEQANVTPESTDGDSSLDRLGDDPSRLLSVDAMLSDDIFLLACEDS